jgi:hypothetical protein
LKNFTYPGPLEVSEFYVFVYKSTFNRSYSLVTQKVDEIYVVPSQVTSSKKVAMADGDFGGTSHLPETVRKVIDQGITYLHVLDLFDALLLSACWSFRDAIITFF